MNNQLCKLIEDFDDSSINKMHNLINHLESVKYSLEDELESIKAKITQNNETIKQLEESQQNITNICINYTENITCLNNYSKKASQLLEKCAEE